MANGHGGYRAPARPAATSGPGNLSRRTDGGPGSKQMVRELSGGAYGDRQDFSSIESGAAMSPAPGVPSPGGATPQTPEALGLVGLDAPSVLPGQPVTQGASLGPGAGPEVLGLGGDPFTQSAQHWAKDLPVLEALANRPGVDPIVRKLVNRIKARL